MLSASERAIAQAALASGPHAVVSADREGIIRDWNETAEHIFGHSAGQAIGRALDLISSGGGARQSLAQLPACHGDPRA